MRFMAQVQVCAALFAIGCSGGAAPGPDPLLLQPTDTLFRAQAPDTFRVRFTTTEGEFTIEVYRGWAPLGADRFYNLVRAGFFDGNRFFRVVPGFVAQFGLHGDPAVNDAWAAHAIPDDPIRHSNRRGTLAFAMAGPGTRTTQVFINYRDNEMLDFSGFAPIGRVVDGMMIVDRLHGEYGETAPTGRGPDEVRLRLEGEDYMRRNWPELDMIQRAALVAR